MRGSLGASPGLLATLSIVTITLCLAVVAVLLAFAACQPPARAFDAKDVVAAGNFAIEYGQKMQRLGARMIEHGQATNDPSWIGDGQHWVIDGKRMIEIGESALKLGQSMQGNPVKAQEVDISKVRAQGQGLISEGKAFAEHGKVMVELTELLKHRAEASGDQRLMEDAAESSHWSERMRDIGEQLTNSGHALVGFADTLGKSIGR